MEHVEVLKDQFIDFAGKTHYFILAAVSTTEESHSVYNEDGQGDTYAQEVAKVVKFGLSICNPLDKFDEELGVLKATGRARKLPPSIYTTVEGLIGKEIIQVAMKHIAASIKAHPEDYITGYEQAENKWRTQNRIQKLENNLTPTEKIVLEESKKDPHFLDNVREILRHYKK